MPRSVKPDETKDSVKDYYANVLKSKDDLQTSACCTAEATPMHLRPLLKNIHEDVQSKFYGCGSPIPPAVEGCTILDLGCGSGQDVYLLSQLVGPKGKVIGIDMTEEQLAVARQHIDWHTDNFSYSAPNVDFREGFIEDLQSAGIEDNSIDVVISNCVINLSPDKEAVFREIFRVLKPGGELYFSDVFAGRRIPEDLKSDPVLLGECLSGALYTEDFRRILQDVGCLDYRVVSSTPFTINNPEIEKKIGHIDFYSMTMSAFKCDFEDICENYGQSATYKGNVEHSPDSFTLDDHHEFKTGAPMAVCGNTAKMVSETRLAPHFEVQGDMSTHQGPFDCVLAKSTKQTGGCC
ncbi:MAG: methyltransferase [Micavibrio sp.]|nr:MAG: methyltransferase [Micavibrio sp.]